MSERTLSRRSLLAGLGGTTVAVTGSATIFNSTARAAGGWTEVESPTSKTIYGVSMTTEGPVAAGASGNVLQRIDGTWEIVVENGPNTRKSGLRALAVTDDGKRVWFAGSSGALGAYDVTTGTKYNYSAPEGKTSTWEAITLTGSRDAETIHVANGSGEVLIGTTDEDGCVSWGSVTKPGSGSTIPAIDYRESDTTVGHAVDTSSNAFETTDGGQSWERVGIPNSQVNLNDVISFTRDGTQRVYVAAGGGKVYRLDCACMLWTPTDLGSGDLLGITRSAGDKLVCGSGGQLHEKREGASWERLTSPVSSDLNEITYGGTDYPDVAVGRSGVILER
jgi:photosystem II stability/assembly factor-like uncharacterized protein